jgi:hypothetical protein
MVTFETIIAAYIRDHQNRAAQEQRWFALQPTLEKAISVAALALTPSGKRFSHQRRIPVAVLERARAALMSNIEELASITTFDDLHSEVANITLQIPGIGELYVYDTALRIGAKLGLVPLHVYVHAGVREGIKNLGLDPGLSRIAISELPAQLQALQPYEIEDVLCIYKDQIAGEI